MKRVLTVLFACAVLLAGSLPVSAAELMDGDVLTAAEMAEQITEKVKASDKQNMTLRIKSAKSVSADDLRAVQAAVGGKNVTLRFDTMQASGKNAQGRLYLEPAKLTGRKGAVLVGVYTEGDAVAAVKAKMQGRYTNTMAIIHMEHTGTLTAEAKVTARVSLGSLNTDNLYFYVYNANKDKVTQITAPRYSIEKKYLTFYTKQAGDVIVTDSKLRARSGTQSANTGTPLIVLANDDEQTGTSSGSGSGATQVSGNVSAQSSINARAYARTVFDLVNKERVKAGLDEVSWSDDLYECAVIRAEEMSIKFGHERPYPPTVDRGGWPSNTNGKGIYNAPSVADELGIDYDWIMENAGAGYRSPEAAVSGWMKSSGHRANILRPSHEVCGVGVYAVPKGERDPEGYGIYWALLLDGPR